MNAAVLAAMRPAMRQPLSRLQAMKPIPRQQLLRSSRPFHSSRTMLRTKEEDHSAHTITQRLRSLKRIPPELLPLGVVIAFALFAAAFAMGKKLFTDKTLRLYKNPPKAH